MTTELAVLQEDWLKLGEAKGSLPKPFERIIDLGEYEVRGLNHLDNPTVRFRALGMNGKLALRIGENGACELVQGTVVFGNLPIREGHVFNALLRGGKRLVGRPVAMSAEGIEPEMKINVQMEEI